MVEQLTLNQLVLGSSPSRGTNLLPAGFFLRKASQPRVAERSAAAPQPADGKAGRGEAKRGPGAGGTGLRARARGRAGFAGAGAVGAAAVPPGARPGAGQPLNFLTRMLALWPPKPKELLRAASIFMERGVLGT